MYYDWMMEHYLGKDTPRGDLAGDMRRAGDFPRSDDKETLHPAQEDRPDD